MPAHSGASLLNTMSPACSPHRPRFVRSKQQDPDGALIGDYDLSQFSHAVPGRRERCDPDTLHWAETKLGVPVIDHWWQTETGWAIASNCVGIETLPVKPGSIARAVPGWDVAVLDGDGTNMSTGQVGAIVCKLPLPPGTLPGFWQADERYKKAYLERFPGYYETGDAGYIDEDGYIYVMSTHR